MDKKVKWSQRRPSLKRFVFWNIFCWLFGSAALVGGILYTEHVVRPMAASGSTDFVPLSIGGSDAQAEAGKRVFGNNERINILVLGIDYNYDNQGILYTKGARSDTIIVLSLNRDAKYFNVVSIPRDTRVLISEEYGYDKINSAYSYGGVEQTRQTVSNFLGIPIHHHVILKVSGAKEVLDALGGLAIDVEKDMDYDDNWGKLHIHLKKGPQVLNGEQAVGYARFRMDEEGDRGRIRRQQQVVRALGRKLKEPALLTRLPDVARVVQKSIETDLVPLQMVDLANLYSSFDFSRMRSGAIVGDDATDSIGASYIEPYEPENRRTVRRLLQDLNWLSKDDLRIRIYYKYAPESLAYTLADHLYDAGFRGVQVEALPLDSPADTKTTNVVWYNKVPRLVGVLNAALGTRPSTEARAPESRDDDLAIYLGDNEQGDWKPIPESLTRDRHPAEEPVTKHQDDRNTRYHSEFQPRYIPGPEVSEWESQEYEPSHDDTPPASFDDAMREEYPTSTDRAPLRENDALEAPEPPPALEEPVPEAPAPKPVEIQIDTPDSTRLEDQTNGA